MADIFLSYAFEDRERVARLVELLEANGFSIWWDRRIGIGSSFDREIERELAQADCVVVVWSNASIDSDWVREEATEGLERNILIPVQIDDCRLPLGFRRAQTASLVGWPGIDGDLNQLLDRVRELVSHTPAPPAEATDARKLKDDEPAIAVLPFVNMSPDPDNVYFSDGISEEILNGLTKVAGIKVIARTSSFQFRADRDIREIAELLGVTHVLEGSVRKAGDRVRITAQLIRADDGIHLWSESYNRDLLDIFEVQEEISATILRELETTLIDHAPTARGRVDPKAYDAYLLGTYHMARFDLDRAIELYEQSIELAPDFADVYGAISRAHHLRLWFYVPPGPELQAIERYVAKALELDSNQPVALAVQANKLFFADREYQAALDMFHDLLVRFPNNDAVVSNAKNPMVAIGRFDLSLRLCERLVELDPLSPFAFNQLGPTLRGSGRFADAEAAFQRNVALGGLDTANSVATAIDLGNFDKAERSIKLLIDSWGADAAEVHFAAMMLAEALGDTERREKNARAIIDRAQTAYVQPLVLSHARFVLGDDAWIDCIQQGLDERHYGTLNFLRLLPAEMALTVWEKRTAMLKRPEYQALLESVNLDDASVADLRVQDLPF